MSLLKRRLSKIEKALAPDPRQDVRIVIAPGDDAGEEALDAHQQALKSALDAADRVFLVSNQDRDRHPSNRRIRVFDSESAAKIAYLALQPSETGQRSYLDDVLQGLSGNVLLPVSEANMLVDRWRDRVLPSSN